jgi:molecular chaperone GrpE
MSDRDFEDRIEPTLFTPGEEPANQNTAEPQPGDVAPEFFGPSAGLEEELRAEIASLKDQALRAMAEVENVRRRAERERQDTARYAVGNFAKAVLQVADNLQRALAHVKPEERAADKTLDTLCVGIEMTETELLNSYTQFGIKPIEAMGKKLDANLHQAMFEVDDPSKPAGTIVQVIQPGYMIHDRLLRPAMVGVSKGGPREVAGAAGSYAKQSDAADREAQGGKPKLDTEL